MHMNLREQLTKPGTHTPFSSVCLGWHMQAIVCEANVIHTWEHGASKTEKIVLGKSYDVKCHINCLLRLSRPLGPAQR